MSRAQTTLNALLAAMFLVSLLPAGQATSDPATDPQEAAIEEALGPAPDPPADVPSNVPWQVRNELQELFLTSTGLSYVGPHPDDAAASATLAGGSSNDPVVVPGDVPEVGGTEVIPGSGPGPAVFTLGRTIADTEVSSFAATLWITTTQATNIQVELLYDDAAATAAGTATEVVVKSITIPIGGVIVALPAAGEASEYTASGLVTPPGLIPLGKVISVRISSDSEVPANIVTLTYGSDENPSRVALTADAARAKAWTEKDGSPGVVQSNFASPVNAIAEDRTVKFHFAQVHPMNETAVQAFPMGFKVIGPDGKVHFDSSGSPVGVNAANNQRWGASASLPADNVGLPGVVQKTFSLTYPQTLNPGAYVIQLKPFCPARVTCPTWTIDVPVNVGASKGAFQLATLEVHEKTILVGQRTTFRLTLSNNGAVEDTYALQANVGSLLPGWVATIAPAQVKLAPGGSTDVELTVIPPANGANGQVNTITATATSLLSGQSFSLTRADNTPVTLRVFLTNVRTHGVEILNATNATTAVPEPTLRLTVSPGGQVALPLFVQNLGNGFDRFVVSLSGAPAGWTASANPGLVELGARSQGASVIRIEAPANAVPANGFLLTVKASRLDNLTQSDTQLIRVVVADLDQFSFQVFNGTTVDTSGVAKPVVRVLRDEGPGSGTTNVYANDNNDPDRQFDSSGLYRLVLLNTGSRPDTYTLTPYVLTADDEQGIAASLAGESSTAADPFAVRKGFGYRDSQGCDGDETTAPGDRKNDGWHFRLFVPSAITDFPTTTQTFDQVRDGDLQVTVPAKGSAVVYAEMKWVIPADTTGCPASAQTGTNARATDPPRGHAVLIEAVSQKDASHRATHVLNTVVEPAGTRSSSQRYGNTREGVVIGAEATESLAKKVTAEARTASFDLRAVNAGNEMDKIRVTVPQFNCPPGSTTGCWENSIPAANVDKRVVFGNADAGNRANGGTCTSPVATTQSNIALRQISFECTLGAFDEVGFRVTTTAPAGGAIGTGNSVRVTVASQDSAGFTNKADDLDVTATITGLYALDIVTGATGAAPILAGGTTAIPFTVKNLGSNDDNVTLDLRDSLTGGWTGDFSVANPVFVPAGRQVDVLLLAGAPTGATADTSQTFEVRATSLDSPAIAPPVDNVTLRAIVRAPTTLLTLAGEPQNVLANPGEAETLVVKATKTSANPATAVDLTIDPTSLPSGWTASFSSTASQPTKTVTFSSGTATTEVFVTPPATALGTSRAAVRIAAHTDGSTNAGDADTFAHIGVSLSSPNLGIEIASPDGEKILVAAGSATKTRLTVENLGVGQDVIRLTAGSLPTGWNAVFDAENITLQPLQTRSINVTVTAPADLASGQSRLLTFIATTSDGLRTDSVQVNFTTGQSVLGLTTNVVGTLRQLPQEPFTFTVNVNNTGDLPDDLVMRSGLTGTFKDVVQMEFAPASLELEPGKSGDVSVTVTFPAGLAANLEVPLVIEAASSGPFLDSVGAVTVAARVLDHKVRDVDGDLSPEYAADRDLDASNGFEQYRDPSTGAGASTGIDAASFLSEAAKSRFTVTTTVDGTSTSVLRFTFDPDQDKKTDLLVDTDADGQPDVYWDPDRAYSHEIPVLKDVTGDGREDFFFDLDGEGGLLLDVFYDPVEGRTGRLLQVDIDNNGDLDYVVDSNDNNQPDLSETVLFGGPDGTIASIRETADVDGDGKVDSVIDSDGDGRPDYFIPNGKTAGVPIVLEDVDGDGVDDWTYDSDGDGLRDSYYNPVTKESGLLDSKGDFLGQLAKYWYIGALFGVVLALFVVLLMVTRR